MAVVLIIDDNDEIRVLLKAVVERRGHRGITAASCAEARATVAQKPDAILADVDLKGECGVSLVAELQKQGSLESTAVAFVSGRADAKALVTHQMKKCVPIIEKPFRFSQIDAVLEGLLKR